MVTARSALVLRAFASTASQRSRKRLRFSMNPLNAVCASAATPSSLPMSPLRGGGSPPAASACKSWMRKILTPSMTAAAMRPTSPASPTRTPVSSWREACAITANTPSACAINVLVLRKSSFAAELLAAARSCGLSLLTSTRRSGRGCGTSLVSVVVTGRWSGEDGWLTGSVGAAACGESPTSNVERSRGPAALFSTISSDLPSILQRVGCSLLAPPSEVDPPTPRMLYNFMIRMEFFRCDSKLFGDRDWLWRRRGRCPDFGAAALSLYLAVDEVHQGQGNRRRADEHVPQYIEMQQLTARCLYHNEAGDHRGHPACNLLQRGAYRHVGAAIGRRR